MKRMFHETNLPKREANESCGKCVDVCGNSSNHNKSGEKEIQSRNVSLFSFFLSWMKHSLCDVARGWRGGSGGKENNQAVYYFV